MLDQPDIVRDAEGNIDGYATLSATQSDAARYTHPETGEDVGLAYGPFIGVASNLWSNLGPYISARVNDDPLESKRVELFPLPQAGNQSRVRLRFAQAGTGSWYFGVDNVGLYNIETILPPAITEAPQSQLVSAGAALTLQVTATGEGLRYQWKLNGANLPGQTNSTLSLPSFGAANAGDYQVIVSNEGGDVPSAVAKLELFSGAIRDDLVTHLKFDNSLEDSSGRNNHGSAVGGPTFSEGKIGANAVHIPSGSDYVTLGLPTDLEFGTDVDFSIAFWAKTTEWGGDPAFISNKDWNSGGNQGYVLATDGDGHFQWNLSGPPGARKDFDGTPGFFTNLNWHHIAVTFDRNGNASTYLDGKLVNVRPISGDQNDVNTPPDFATNIGQDGTGGYGSSFFDADIDDLGIWRRVLTPQEVAAIFEIGQAGQDLSTVVVQPTAQDVTQPGDTIVSSSSDSDSPAAERVANAIDNNSQTKYLNFLKLNTGFTVTPSAGASILTGIALTSANDAPERDPASFRLEGSNDGTTFTPVAEGTVPPFSERFARRVIRFTNAPAVFQVVLSGSAERPNPVTTSASGSGTLTVAGDQVSYNITYTGLSAAATAGHIHGPAGLEEAAGVMVPFTGVTGTSGTLTGTLTLSATQLEALRAGRTYVNIHTSTNPGGEIRGQILPASYKTYRLTFPTVANEASANSMQIAEVELLGTVVGSPEPPASNISISSAGGQLTITYQGELQAADQITGPFAPVQGASSPYAVNPVGGTRFFIAR